MVTLNLDSGTKNINMDGDAVITIVIGPKGHDADCAALLTGNTSPYAAAVAAGNGIGTIINELGRNTYDRAMLAAKVIEQIKGTINGKTVIEKDVEVFEGTMEEFENGSV